VTGSTTTRNENIAMQEASTQHPTSAELTTFSLKAFKGIEVGLGQADPVASIAKTLEEKYPGHMILVQAGKFLHGYDRSAYALHTLKQFKLKLVGTSDDPHIRVGFPAGNFKRRLWPMVEEFGIPYVVSLGSLAEGRTVYVSDHGDTNAAVLSAVSDKVIEEVIHDLKMRGELNKASAKQLLANPDTSNSSRTRRISTHNCYTTSSRCRATCASPTAKTCAPAWAGSCAASLPTDSRTTRWPCSRRSQPTST
jgi:hypothetical protein